MIEIKITAPLPTTEAGVYRIDFSNGRFYIGSSVELKTRIKTHENAIKSGFKTAMTCKSLLPMTGFNGFAVFSLLEAVELPESKNCQRRGLYQSIVLKREWTHIRTHKGNDMMLNDHGYGIGNETITASIDPEIKRLLKERAKNENIPIARLVGKLILAGLSIPPIQDENHF